MVKEYEMTGTCPIVVGGYGRVEAGAPNFSAEMDAQQEAFFQRIGALRVVRELPGASVAPLPPPPIDGLVEFEGRTLSTLPTGWPHRDEELAGEPE